MKYFYLLLLFLVGCIACNDDDDDQNTVPLEWNFPELETTVYIGSSVSGQESDSVILVPVMLMGNEAAATVTLHANSEAYGEQGAVEGKDFNLETTTITFNQGEKLQYLKITPINDPVYNAQNKYLDITIVQASGAQILPQGKNCKVTITDVKPDWMKVRDAFKNMRFSGESMAWGSIQTMEHDISMILSEDRTYFTVNGWDLLNGLKLRVDFEKRELYLDPKTPSETSDGNTVYVGACTYDADHNTYSPIDKILIGKWNSSYTVEFAISDCYLGELLLDDTGAYVNVWDCYQAVTLSKR